ncbi:MAG TPA: Spy/CpxP family protein refolding chaperone [Thermodesulfobacteriota bacterium]|nr:Spy/CpxP family protein refolding chaperone [Thermodesulfobacteriota bacterium]
MTKPKLIGGLILVFILGALAGAWGNQLYFMHSIKPKFERFAKRGLPPCMSGHRMERFAECGPPPCMFGHRMEGCSKIINELDLTLDQKKKVDDILNKHQEERKKLMANLREAKKQLYTVASAKEFDEAAFRKSFQQVSSIKESLAVLRAKMIPELKAVLTPEQIGYLKGRMATKREFWKKGFWEGLPPFVEPDIQSHYQEKHGDQPNS